MDDAPPAGELDKRRIPNGIDGLCPEILLSRSHCDFLGRTERAGGVKEVQDGRVLVRRIEGEV